MKLTKIKPTAAAMIIYLALTVGLCMFLYAEANSYNRLHDDKLEPAKLEISQNTAELTLIGKRFVLRYDALGSDSRVYLWLYILAPSELRNEVMIGANLRF